MAAFGDAYGFTPESFFDLTLPQLAEYGEFAKRQSDAVNDKKSSSSSSTPGGKSVSSLDEFVSRYGEKSKASKPKNGV
jgi:hypothetical protein